MPSLATDAAAALLTSLGNEARGLFAIGDNPLVDPSGFLADPDAPPLSQQPAKALGRFICRRWARFDGDSNNPAADRLYARACGPYLDSIGEGVDPGDIGPPYEGGQCPTSYQVFATSAGEDLFIGGQSPRNLTGPLGAVTRVDTPVGGGLVRRQFIFSGPNDGPEFTELATSTFPPGFRIAGRVDGLPDDCGNPPPEYTRPRPPIVLPPIVPIFIDLPDIGPVNVDVELFPDGTIEIGSPTLNVDVTIAPPNVDGGGGGGDGGEDVPGPGSPRPPEDTGPGGDAEGSVPPGEELVGVLVEVLESPIGANTYDGVSETIFRGVGYVRMGYPGRLALDMGGAALRSPQFFLAPVRGLTAWQVKANNGFRLRATPYFREV